MRASLRLSPQWRPCSQLHVGRLPDTAPRSFYLSWTPQSLSFAPFPTPLPPRRASLRASGPPFLLPPLPPPSARAPSPESQRIYANYFKPAPGSPAQTQSPGPRPPRPSSPALSSLPTQPRWLLISIAWPGSRSPLPGAASVSRGTDVRVFINWEPRNNGIIPPREGTLPLRLSEASL